MTSNLNAIKAILMTCCLLVPLVGVGQEEDVNQALPADVRLVIDVSGSMKRNDPNDLRQPAVELLVKLLPEGSKAGVWTFGRWVNMLVKHQDVDGSWREDALEKALEINSVGLFTNIGEALEKAAYDMAADENSHRKSIILLTDGMVDIDKEPEKNRREWRRIVDEVLPKLESAGITVHTIALSDNADTDLLNKLSLSTDGIAEVAKTADDLMRIFLKAFDAAAPMEEVPLSDEGFVIDSSVEEFTALIFRQTGSAPTQIIGPDQESIDANTKSKYVNWYRDENYDLITVKQPLEGQWQVIAEMEPDSRITVVSNLNLRVRPLPNNIFKGQKETASFLLQQDGTTVKDSAFLSLMEIKATMMGGRDEFDLREFWSQDIITDPSPENGVFRVDLPVFEKQGLYQLDIVVDGKSFMREFSHQFTTRQPFDAEIEQRYDEGRLEYVLIARSYDPEVVVKDTQVVATIVDPDGRKKIRPLNASDRDTWQTIVRPSLEGEYTANVIVRGESQEEGEFEFELAPVQFTYSIDAGFVEEEKPFFAPSPTPQATPVPTPTPTPAPTATPVAKSEPAKSEGPGWLVYLALGLGNLLLFGLGFLAYRKIMGSSPEEIIEELDEESDETETEEVDEEPDEDDLDEEEPPMEDIDPVENEDDEDDDEMDSSASDDANDEPESEVEPEEEPDLAAYGLDDDDMDDDEEPPEPEPKAPPATDADKMAAAIDLIEDEDYGDPPPKAKERSEAKQTKPEPAAKIDDDAGNESDETPSEQDPEDEDSENNTEMDEPDDLEQMAMDAEDAEEEGKDEEDMVSAMLKEQGLDLAEDEFDDAISSLIDELENDDSLDDFDDEDIDDKDKS